MAVLNPLVVVAGQVRELPALDSLYATTQGVGTAGNVVASTLFVRNAVGAALIKDVGSGGFVALNTSEASNPIITVTGALTSNATLELPVSAYRIYAIYNNTTGGFSLSIKQAGASPVVPVTQGTRALIVTNGGAFDALTDFDGIALTGVSTAPTAAAGTNTTQIATMAAVQAAVQGVLTKSTTGGTTTLTAAESSNPIITVAGTLTSNAVIEIPTGVARLYAVSNQTTGAFSVSVKQVGFASLAGIAQGKKNVVYTSGFGAFDALTDYESIVLTGVPLAPTMPTSADGFEVANTAFVKAAIAAGGSGASGSPSGTLVFHAASSPPPGYLKANGALVSRTTYADLFAAIGTVFGVGDGSTTFALPDLRGRFIRSWVDGGAIDVGRAFGSLQADELKGHGHAASASAATVTGSATVNSRPDNPGGMGNVAVHSNYGVAGSLTATLNTDPHSHTITVAATTGAETRPANIALLACIKF